MLACFVKSSEKKAIPIKLVVQNDFEKWIAQQPGFVKNWLAATQFRGEPGNIRLVPNQSADFDHVVCGLSSINNFWDVGALPFNLPEGHYIFDNKHIDYLSFACAWGLGAYQFSRYKSNSRRQPAKLVLPKSVDRPMLENIVESIYFVRDLINTPTDDMGPSEFSAAAAQLSKTYHATFKQIVGDDLLKHHFASIYTVGRASDDPPRLLEIRWGNKKNPKVTLVGKGVCFDSGGLDIKPSSAMLLMKKDMAGGAHVLGLAQMIMRAKIPIYLHVLIPVVENVIAGNAYRPGDIIKSRKGLTIEIGNTDAEGRVILADALTYAAEEKPDLLIDITTLTGAARIALGTELPAVFSHHDDLVEDVIKYGQQVMDPIWRLPLFQLYRDSLDTPFADINNCSVDGYGGAITAALFLKEFISDEIPWLHFDMMAWNLKSRAGRPQGGEAMAIRGLFHYLLARFKH